MYTEPQQKLLACRYCDLLQQEVSLPPHHDAHCIRCGALLYRGTRARLDWMLALVLGSAILFLVSNLFPIASLHLRGAYTATTLTGCVLALYHQGRPLVAALVLLTTVLVPALELGVLLYMLLPLRAGRIVPGMPLAFRFVLAAHEWSMMEVFLLGLLVTLAKLSDVATIVPGLSLWAFIGLIALFSGVATSFSARDFWSWVEALHADGSHARRT